MLALAFPPYELSLLSWIAFVPLLYAIRGCRPYQVLVIAWLQAWTFYSVSGSWVFATLRDYAHLSIGTSALEFVMLGLMLAGFCAFAVAIAHYVSETLSLPRAITLPIAWTAQECLRARMPLGFPWNLVGYAAYQDIHLIQFAEFTGVYGISALIIFVNVELYEVLVGPSAVARRKALWGLTAIPSLALLFGFIAVARLDSTAAAGRLKVALISGGVPPTQARTSSSRREAFDLYRTNTHQTLALHPDLIIWPESAAMCIFQPTANYPTTMAEDAGYRSALVKIAIDSGTPILFGALAFKQAHGQVTMFNRAYLLSRTGEVADYYDKMRLVPFGEYLPMQQFLGARLRTITTVQHLHSGDSDAVFNLAGIRIAVRICYESIFPHLMRDAVANGADLIVNISNDAWYGTAGARQALAMTAMRAVETRRPLVRVANQGISAVISPTGRIQIASRFIASGDVREVEWPAGSSFYVRVGDVFGLSCVALIAIGLVLAVYVRRLPRRALDAS